MVVLNGELRVLVASRAFYEKFDTNFEVAHNKLFYELSDGQWNIPKLRELLEKILPEKKIIENFEMEQDFKGLGVRTVIINAHEIVYENGQRKMLLSIQDVTDIKKLMDQKDTLLREMRHRIANSLQLIASVILLKASSVTSEESKLHLQDAHDRILSIATVQRNLDPTSATDEVPMVDYLTTLCRSVAKSMIGGRKPITITVTGTKGSVVPDTAISLGLITTELVINSLKHAFPNGEGDVTVTYTAVDEDWTLTIADNGVGIPVTTKFNKEGLGSNIIDSLANQLNAVVQRESSHGGTTVSIVHSGVLTKSPIQNVNAQR